MNDIIRFIQKERKENKKKMCQTTRVIRREHKCNLSRLQAHFAAGLLHSSENHKYIFIPHSVHEPAVGFFLYTKRYYECKKNKVKRADQPSI